MTPHQIELVKTTWAKVKPIAPTAANLFYTKLFELDPKLRPLFKSDMKEQGEKLMQMIGVAVANLDNLDGILEPVRALGRRHVGYNVHDEDYNTVGAALLWTLEQGLAEAYTGEVREAWAETYTTLADVMKAAAKQAA